MNRSPESFALPDWVVAAFAEAKQLADEANALWAAGIGAHTVYSGFQVDPVVQEIDGKDDLRFASVLFGGRQFVGTGAEVRAAQRAYIAIRSKSRKAAA